RRRVAAADAAARGDVGALERGHQLRDVLRLVLQVAVHRHDRVAPRAGEPRVHRGVLAEVPLQAHRPHAGVGGVESRERGQRAGWTSPRRYAGEHESGRIALYCGPGNRGKTMKAADPHGYLAAWVRGDPSADHVWQDTHVLRFMREGDAHTIEIMWAESWSLV